MDVSLYVALVGGLGALVACGIHPWSSAALAALLLLVGCIALAVSPVDDDIRRYAFLAVTVWIAAGGLVVGLILRGFWAGLRGRRGMD